MSRDGRYKFQNHQCTDTLESCGTGKENDCLMRSQQKGSLSFSGAGGCVNMRTIHLIHGCDEGWIYTLNGGRMGLDEKVVPA